MYLNILKKDIKRKKTMNVILLIFIILAVTFISSSVNNLVSIATALDHYFQKAGLSDFQIITIGNKENDDAITEFLNENGNVKRWSADEHLYVTTENLRRQNGEKISLSGTGLVSRAGVQHQKFFDAENQEITSVEGSEIYLPLFFMNNNHLEAGDKIKLSAGDFQMEFTVAGNCKDALLGSSMMGTTRMLVSDAAYARLEKEGSQLKNGFVYSVEASDPQALRQDFDQGGYPVAAIADKNLVSTSYIMDMVLAGVLLVVSLCLILISLVILRFTIVFTLNEEFREIGVMKAIGIRGRKIRNLYLIKYLAISLVGAVIGFFLGIPFGNLLLTNVSANIVLSASNGGLLLNLVCSLLIVAVILLFCSLSTRKVNRFSPIDAIRNGSSGERYRGKGLFRLGKSKIPVVPFLAFNDICSNLKKYAALLITFTIGILLVIIPVNTVNTLNSDHLITWFGMIQSDAYLTKEGSGKDYISEGGRDRIKDDLASMEETLRENGIDARASMEMIFKFSISMDSKSLNVLALQGNGTAAGEYDYTDGQPPKYADEIALTFITADKIGAHIGDTVTIKTGNQEKEYLVTAIYQSMNNLGEGLRFSEKAELDYTYAIESFAFQLFYRDAPSAEAAAGRMNQLKSIFPEFEVKTAAEYIGVMTGNVAEQFESVKWLIVFVVLAVNMLVAVLMVRTFITKEKGEIGMLKSIGFRSRTIMCWQTLRIGMVLLLSSILGSLLSGPVTQLSSGKVFERLGTSHVEFAVNPLEVYLLYPLLILALTLAASMIAALQVKKISAQETNNLE